MTTLEVANKLVEMCRAGQIMEAIEELYADNAVSSEPAGAPMAHAEGKANLIAKGQHFASMIEEHHGMEITGPIVANEFFTIGWNMEVTMKGMGRQTLNEICLYEVKDGKIVAETFFYNVPAQA